MRDTLIPLLRRIGAWLLPLAALTTFPIAYAAEDFHALFEERCAGCHGHAGGFARETLVLEAGALRGRESGRAIAPFLRTHRGGLSAEETALFTAVFVEQIESGGLFLERCAVCHRRARGLVKGHLILEEGRLRGRYSGYDTRAFLEGHGRATAKEAALLYDALLGIARGRR